MRSLLSSSIILAFAAATINAEEAAVLRGAVRRHLIVYNNPQAGGGPIDFCMAKNGEKFDGCGQPSADFFCKTHGFAKADSFKKAYGLTQATYFQGGRTFNYNGSPDSFESIDCVGTA